MDKIEQPIRHYIQMNPSATQSEIIMEISNIIGGDAFPGEAKSIYNEMVDKVFVPMCITDPQGNDHWSHKLL